MMATFTAGHLPARPNRPDDRGTPTCDHTPHMNMTTDRHTAPRRLGKSGIEVSPMGLGCWAIGSLGA